MDHDWATQKGLAGDKRPAVQERSRTFTEDSLNVKINDHGREFVTVVDSLYSPGFTEDLSYSEVDVYVKSVETQNIHIGVMWNE
ncbi:hypothetical protein TNCV_2325541 [Trichonephila clavipes]|nr:hypothetical protein TNCV_2325541 [Trichonephila clavipes]